MKYKSNTKIVHQSSLYDSFSSRTASVLDNKETLLHFSHDNDNKRKHKADFLKSYYRWQNLQLCDALFRSQYNADDHIEKAIRRLSWCSSLGLVEESPSGAAHIVKSSKTCKHPFCHICNRRKSSKLVQRLMLAIADPELKEMFDNKYYYFLTLTVLHDRKTRNYNYLKEFRNYQAKLFRSKIWKTHFPNSKESKQSGWISSIENVIKKSSYHIHSHILIVSPRLKDSISNIEKDIRAKWFKITGDSTSIQLDLVKNKSKITTDQNGNEVDENILSAVREVFKYTTKVGDYKKLDVDTRDLLAEWIIETKGKNFINAFGMLRGLQLTALKSKYDTLGEIFQADPDRNYHYDITSSILYNHRTDKVYSSSERREIIEKVHILALSPYSMKVDNVLSDVLGQLIVGRSDEEIIENLPSIITHYKEEKVKFEQAVNDAWEWSDQLAADEKIRDVQMSMIDKLFANVEEIEVPF